MSFDKNGDGKVSFDDLTTWFKGTTFGIANWVVAGVVGVAVYVLVLAPKRKGGRSGFRM